MVVVQKQEKYREIPIELVKSAVKPSREIFEDVIELPKVGSKIPVEKFHVSKTNVNVEEPFGESEEDRKLIANLKAGKKIVQPFKARPEGDGYGIYIGRRRFLGKKNAGAKFFVVGVNCLINNVTDEEAEEASWIENFKGFQKGMNPITRAKRLEKIVSRWGIRGYSRRSGIPASSLSEYLKVSELSPKMQRLLAKNLFSYREGVKIARMNLAIEMQDKLGALLLTEGLEAFKKQCKLIRKKGLTEHAKKGRKKTDYVIPRKRFWKELTQSLREFANYWADYCKLEEWEDVEAHHLTLEVTMPKDLNEPSESDGLETLSADEAPQICGSCGQDILEGDEFTEGDGLYYCRECSQGRGAFNG